VHAFLEGGLGQNLGSNYYSLAPASMNADFNHFAPSRIRVDPQLKPDPAGEVVCRTSASLSLTSVIALFAKANLNM
jgi:hypothetical protein